MVTAGEETTLEEYGLSETSAARVLAATELLSVRCDRCGATSDVGASLVHSPELRSLVPGDATQWSASAVATYRFIVEERLADRLCNHCGASVRAAKVERAVGGSTLPEFGLEEDAAVALIAWTQSLTVRCPRCARDVDVR